MKNLKQEAKDSNKPETNYELRCWGHEKVNELEQAFGINLNAVLFSKELDYLEIKKQAMQVLIDGVDRRNKRIGFTDLLSDGSDPVLTSVNMSMPMKNLETISNYNTKEEIEQYYKDQGDKLSQAVQESSKKTMARQIVGAGLFNISNIASLTTAGALIEEIPLIGSVVKGIEAVPGKFVNYISGAIIGGIMWALGLRQSAVTGMVVNGTNYNFVVKNWEEYDNKDADSDLYLSHGHIDDFMADHDGILLDDPKVQIMKRVDISESDDFEYMVFAGTYIASKNTTIGLGYYGTEGTMIFTNTSNKHPLKFAHQFAVPYSASNGTNIKLLDNDDDQSIKDLNQELYDDRDEYVSVTKNDHKLTSAINSKHGQEGLILATIRDTRL